MQVHDQEVKWKIQVEGIHGEQFLTGYNDVVYRAVTPLSVEWSSGAAIVAETVPVNRKRVKRKAFKD